MAFDAAKEQTETETEGSGYSVTDPGYETIDETTDESREEILANLRAENTTGKPSKTLDDAGGDKDDTEGSDETSTETGDAETTSESDDDFGISDELLDRAIDLGYTLEEMRQFNDAKALEKEINRVEKIRTRFEQKKAASVAPPETEEEEPDWNKLIEMGHDEDIIKLSKMNYERMKQAESLVKQLANNEHQRQSIEQANRFDDALSGMEDFQTLFGKGRRDSLGKAELKNRQAVFTKMVMLRNGYEQAGLKVPDEADLIQEAVQASFYKHAQQAARSGLKRQIKQAASQSLSRPNASGKTKLTGEQRALEKERRFWREHRE